MAATRVTAKAAVRKAAAKVATKVKAGMNSKAGAKAGAKAARAKPAAKGAVVRGGRSRMPAEKPEGARRRMAEILRVLRRTYPEAECSLFHRNPFELLMATILSAQCTDERVNKVTPALFERFPDAASLAAGKPSEVEHLIRSTNFYRNKAKALQECSRALVDRHGGEVPRTLEELVELRGVGRKTANVILGVGFGVPGLVVDTHVGRLSRRMGFTRSEDAVEVEHEMMEVVPREDWTHYAHLLIDHGRAICTARRAFCERCPIAHLCPKVGVDRTAAG